ncbi:MAG: glycosyltransferase family 2 protein [Burkholderiales bacterium]|nr:glycosyltransferase family 2 protein [Burkholderiales bacterium]
MNGSRDSAPTASVGWRVFGKADNLQAPFDVAVVMPTIIRPTVLTAIQSVFDQSPSLRVQLLIGIDAALAPDRDLLNLLRHTPSHVTSFLFYPGYSTSVRHGGPQLARDGGSLRSVLTYLANARRVAYLDDDNWWHPEHLTTLLEAIEGHDWAFSLRWFVHHQSREPICPDIWESVGPGEGLYAARFGGWVDPNCLMFDKIACDGAVRWWCTPLAEDAKGMSGDRRVYDYLQHQGPPGSTRRPTAFYALQPDDIMHTTRIKMMGTAYSEVDRRAKQLRT